MLYDPSYIKFPEQANLQKQKQMSGYTGLSWSTIDNGYQFSSWGDENILKLDNYNGCTTPKIFLKPLNYTCKGGELYAM